jgi:hypothetical protein
MTAVRQAWRNKELVLGSDLHQLERFSPAFDHTANRKTGRLTAFVGAVEFSAVNQRPPIIHSHGIGVLGLRPVAFFDHFVLQTAGGRLDPFLGFISGEEFLRLSVVFLCGFLLSFLHILAERHHRVPDFLFGEKRLSAVHSIFHPGNKHILI